MTRHDEFLTRAARVADIGLSLGGMLALLMFSYFFYHYGWAGDRQFSSSRYVVLYYGLPSIIAAVLFSSLRLEPEHRVNLALALVTSSVSLYALEFFIESRYASLYAGTKPLMTLFGDSSNKRDDAAALTRDWGVEIDPRTADEVLAALQKDAADAVPVMTPSNELFIAQPDGSVKSAVLVGGQEVMPLAAVSNRVTLLCNETGQWIHYRSDARGFNNSNEIWHADRLDIAALGDSFVHGYCVTPERNFLALIRQRYPVTLNLGVSGDGPLLMLATLEEYLPRFRPKIVLWFYYEGNDLTDLQSERKSALLRNYLKDGFTQSALARQDDIDRAIVGQIPRVRALEESRRKAREDNRIVGNLLGFARLSLLRERLGMIGGMDADDREITDLEGPDMGYFRDVLVQAKARVDAWGGRLEFVYLPEWARYTNDASPGKVRRSEVLALAQNLGIPIIDVDTAFQAHGDPLSLFPFRRNGHYNEVGHQLVAEEVLKALSERR